MEESSQNQNNEGKEPQAVPQKKVSSVQIYILAFIFIVGITIFISMYAYELVANNNKAPTQIACTADAKLCPDGSAVGRVGPNCEFAECSKGGTDIVFGTEARKLCDPEPPILCLAGKKLGCVLEDKSWDCFSDPETLSWKTYHNEEFGFELRFPHKWSGVKIEENNGKIQFYLPDDLSSQYRLLCHIGVLTPQEWSEIKTDYEGTRGIFLKELNGYVYLWGCGHDDGGILNFDDYNQASFNCSNLGQCDFPPDGPYDEFEKLVLPTLKSLE